MRTVLYTVNTNNGKKHEALPMGQSLGFVYSYKIGKKRRTVSDVEGYSIQNRSIVYFQMDFETAYLV